MPCIKPLKMWWTGKYTANGKREFSFKELPLQHPYANHPPVEVPCKQCIHCRLMKSKETALRSQHEITSFKKNCFITLTVSNEYIDEIFPNGSLDHRPFQLFAKRLRKKFQGFEYVEHPITKESINPIRILMCGEYGEETNRPHYHAILYNFDFDDKVAWKNNNGIILYNSPSLSKLWKYGHAVIGEANFETSAYIARYVTKKKNGKEADGYLDDDGNYVLPHYCDPETGLLKKPEYIVFPSSYGLGRIYYEQNKDRIFHYDEDIAINRKGQQFKMKPPTYYDRIYDLQNPEEFAILKEKRIKQAKEVALKNGYTPERLATIGRVKEANLKNKLVRKYEQGVE